MHSYLQNPTPVLERGRRYHHAHRDTINERRKRNKQRYTSITMNDGNEKSAVATWQNMDFVDLLLSLSDDDLAILGAAMDCDFDEGSMPADTMRRWHELKIKLVDLMRKQ